MFYVVHKYYVVRQSHDVEADTPEQALKHADTMQCTPYAAFTADEITGYTVDEMVGDERVASRDYHADHTKL